MGDFTDKFTVDEEVKTRKWEAYEKFIARLRSRLGTGGKSNGRPILSSPGQPTESPHYFHIILRTKDQSVVLQIRRDNLYLVGYQMETPAQWLEFGIDKATHRLQHLIDGSSFLGFTGEYGSMANAANHDSAYDVSLGQHQLTDAVNLLAISTETDERAQALIIVVQMICEAIRFQRISNHLAVTFSTITTPPLWMKPLIGGWINLSAALQRADSDAAHAFLLRIPNLMDIESAEEAVTALGLLLYVSDPTNPQIPQAALKLGQPMVEIFSVVIDHLNQDNPAQLYGRITVTDGLSSQDIYNRTIGNCESIINGGCISLSGPVSFISAYDSFVINLNLKDHNKTDPDDDVSRGQIPWYVYDTTNSYNSILSGTVKSKNGSATVSYAVLINAVQATIEVTFVKGTGENPANIHGLITCFSRNFSNEIVLFRHKSDDFLDVRPSNLIPLERSIVAVPENLSLVISAELYDHETQIVKDEKTFDAQFSGTFPQTITGEHGEIVVTVSWTNV